MGNVGCARCAPCWGDGYGDGEETTALNSAAAEAMATLQPPKLMSAMTTVRTQIATMDEAIAQKKKQFDEAEQNLFKAVAEVREDPHAHSVTEMTMLRTLADVARHSLERCQRDKNGLTLRLGQIEGMLLAHQDYVRRKNLQHITTRLTEDVAEFNKEAESDDADIKQITMAGFGDGVENEDPEEAMRQILEDIDADPRLRSRANQFRLQNTPSVPTGVAAAADHGYGFGGGGGGTSSTHADTDAHSRATLEFTSLLDPPPSQDHATSRGPTSTAAAAATRSALNNDERKRFVAMCSDSM
jgi:hypothetical protein